MYVCVCVCVCVCCVVLCGGLQCVLPIICHHPFLIVITLWEKRARLSQNQLVRVDEDNATKCLCFCHCSSRFAFFLLRVGEVCKVVLLTDSVGTQDIFNGKQRIPPHTHSYIYFQLAIWWSSAFKQYEENELVYTYCDCQVFAYVHCMLN